MEPQMKWFVLMIAVSAMMAAATMTMTWTDGDWLRVSRAEGDPQVAATQRDALPVPIRYGLGGLP